MSELLSKKLRTWRGSLRQKEAAALLDLPLPTYRKYEQGKRTPGKLAAVELDRRIDESSPEKIAQETHWKKRGDQIVLGMQAPANPE